jgi:hypothetical protein
VIKLKTIFIIGIFITILFALNSPQSYAQTLAVTVTTGKSSYTYREKVNITGNLTLDGAPVDGLVGIEVNSLNPSFSNYTHFVIRTATIGNPYLGPTNITILSLTTTDTSVPPKPKTTFTKGGKMGINVTVINNYFSTRNIIIAVMACDNDGTPLTTQVSYIQTDILGSGGIVQFYPQFTIDTWVSTGSAKVYANVFSDWPSLRGHPWCSEKNITFSITQTASASPEALQQSSFSSSLKAGSENAYTLSFRLRPYAPQGGYAVNATAFALGWVANDTATFNMPYQVIGDVNFDHNVNVLDLVAVTTIYGAKSGDLNWNPVVDVQPSGQIGITDVVVVTSKYGIHY